MTTPDSFDFSDPRPDPDATDTRREVFHKGPVVLRPGAVLGKFTPDGKQWRPGEILDHAIGFGAAAIAPEDQQRHDSHP